MVCGNSEPKGPQWFSKPYLQEALRTFKDDNTIRIVNLHIVPASAKGDNYLGAMLRIRVDYVSDNCGEDNIQHESYILKSALGDGADSVTSAAMKNYGIYYHEIVMYDKIFPKFREVLKKIGFHEDCFPRTIRVNKAHKSILFEDLSSRDYLMPDVKKGFDKNHVQLVLRKLAKMHAASAFLNSENPGIFQNCDRGIFNKHADGMAPFFKSNVEFCGHMVAGWEGYEMYGEKILQLVPKLMEHGAKIVEPKEQNFNVLIHGDLWCNNTMFKYDEHGDPKDVILLDFQFSCWSSPTIDLHYFLNTSLVEDLRLNHIEEFVHFYYMELRDTLKELKFTGKVPTLQEFWIQYMETAFYAVFSVIVSQPVMINENAEDASFDSLLEQNTERSNRFRSAIFSNKKVHRNLRNLLPIFDRRGLLDIK